MTVAVTGSTGALGGMLARRLAASDLSQRLIVRTPGKAPELPGATVVQAEYSDADAAERALAGVDTLFMVSASESEDRRGQHRTFVDAAARAGVSHIVYTSFVAAAADSTFTLGRDHFATEQAIRETGLKFTILRDNFYLDFLPDLVGEDGVIRGPAGDGRASVVARADIARVAAEVLLHPGEHEDAVYDMTGPEALSLAEVARILSEHGGQPVAFHDESLEEAYASRAKWGAPDWQVEAWVTTYTAFAAGELARVSDDIERLTGVPPMSLETYLTRPR